MALDQLKAFLLHLQDDEAVKQSVLAASTADDVAKVASGMGYSFSGDELLRFSGNKVGRVTVSKQELIGPIGRIHRYFCRSSSEGLGAAAKAFLL